MNRERDIERVLDAWLQPGPTVMPDRLFDDVLERIDRQPQRRLARIQLRISTMRPITLLAAAAAIVVAVGAGIVLLGRPSTPNVGGPTPAPSVAPAPSASAAPSASTSGNPVAALPAELSHTWIGAPRAVPAPFPQDTSVQVLSMDAATHGLHLSFSPGDSRILNSFVEVPAPDELRVTLTGEIGSGCASGDQGRYRWSLSSDGITLTLEAVSDTCAPRAQVLPGAWTRSACRNTSDACLGAVPAGTYSSVFFGPRGVPDKAYGAFGALRFTVPDGWANAHDGPSSYALVPAADYAGEAGDPAAAAASHGVSVYGWTPRLAQTDDCSPQLEPGPSATVDDLAAWVAGRQGVEATTPTALTIGGRPAKMLDVAVAADWTATCPAGDGSSQIPAVALLSADVGSDLVPLPFAGWDGWLRAGQRMRLVFVDIGGGATATIAIYDSSSPSRFDELVAAAMPVIATFEFPE
jgi:hypothetical protein